MKSSRYLRNVAFTATVFASLNGTLSANTEILESDDVHAENEAFSDPQDPCATLASAPGYTQEQIDFFLAIAMGTEFGGYSRVVRKWDRDIKVRMVGSLTQADRNTVYQVVNDLNRLLDLADPNSIDITLLRSTSPEEANFTIHVLPHTEFHTVEPNALRGQLGFAWPVWQNERIYAARIFVSSTDLSQAERSHLIREEFTQSMGLMRDTEDSRHMASIFYQWWTDTTEFTRLDEDIIKMLYRSDVSAGMTIPQVTDVLKRGRPAPNSLRLSVLCQ